MSIQLLETVDSGTVILDGRAYKIGQVGSFVRIPQGYMNLYGIVSEIGASAVPDHLEIDVAVSGQWMTVQLLGEGLGSSFERGISQHPNVGDEVHLVTESDLLRIYQPTKSGQIRIGSLSSAENIGVFIDLDKLVTRHSALVGSTGSGKSTTVASLLRSLCESDGKSYPSARVLLLDIHGEYSKALSDVAVTFSSDPNTKEGQKQLFVPYWALELEELTQFLFGALNVQQRTAVFDRVFNSKKSALKDAKYEGVTDDTLTVDTPIPFSLNQLWYDLLDFEIKTFSDQQKTVPAKIADGDASKLIAPQYSPATTTNTAPYTNTLALGLRRQLDSCRSKLLDHKFDFLLHPGPCEPDVTGKVKSDLDAMLKDWLGHERQITILDLSGVPNDVLSQLIGAILRVVYDALFWSRRQPEGGIQRPLLVVMEEAHRYIAPGLSNPTQAIIHRIVKEGRKYGIGALVVSQRPSEVDETVLSQCGTFVALRLSNQSDRGRVRSTLSDNLSGLTDMLPILRTGEAVISGEAITLPVRCRIEPPSPDRRPESEDPKVAVQWAKARDTEDYARMVALWRAKTLHLEPSKGKPKK
ncbi:MAG TPA: ATP-binding protein [Rhizomicrobium sp.]